MASSKEPFAEPAQDVGEVGDIRCTLDSHVADEIRQELEAVLESAEFRGSHRGQTLLRYLVENALDGSVDRLKERTIGVELFHREASYDTGQDAIVRVAAHDIRKRLAVHYEHADPARPGSTIRISLAAGSYVPEFEASGPGRSGPAREDPSIPPVPARGGKGNSRWLPWILAAGLAALCALLVVQNAELHAVAAQPSEFAILPWSQLAAPGASVTLVPSDANFAFYKSLVHADQPLTFYTTEPWVQGLANRAAAISGLSRITLTGVADTSVSARIGNVLRRAGCSITVRSGRMTEVGDFKSDRPVILLGSAYANPWVSLLSDHLNFRIEYDAALGKQVCKNISPQPGESPVYVGTAHTPDPGVAYATISLVPNLASHGFVLIIAGTDAEGLEAAGELVTDLPQLDRALRRRGIDPAAKVGQLELLLRLHHMNTQSVHSEIIAQRVIR